MKKIKYILPVVALSALMMSCEVSVDSWSGADRLNFFTDRVTDTVINYSFVYQTDDTEYDTVWLEVRTQGEVRNTPREVKLVAVKPYAGIQAQPGVHYVDFESTSIDPKLKAMYAIPAGANSAKMPIVLIRDASLQTKTVQLRIVFEGNDYFLPGFSGNDSHRDIIFTDMLSKPQIWDAAVSHIFGEYGQVKHRFMIEKSGLAFDNEWMEKTFTWTCYTYSDGTEYWYWAPADEDYLDYLAAWFQKKLDEENAERKAANGGVDDPLTENDANKTVVTFL